MKTLTTLSSLPDGAIHVDVDHMVGFLHVNSTTWHPLRSLVDSFLLCFALDSVVVQQLRVECGDEDAIREAVLCYTQSALLSVNKTFHQSSKLANSGSFKALKTKQTVDQKRMIPLNGVSSARQLLDLLRNADNIPPVVVYFRDDTNHVHAPLAEVKPCYLGQFFSGKLPDRSRVQQGRHKELYSVLAVDETSFTDLSEVTVLNLFPHQQGPAAGDEQMYFTVEARYELLGNGSLDEDTGSCGAFILTEWDGDQVTVSRPLAQPPLNPKSCVFCVNGSAMESDFLLGLSDLSQGVSSNRSPAPDRTLEKLNDFIVMCTKARMLGEPVEANVRADWKETVAKFIFESSHKSIQTESGEIHTKSSMVSGDTRRNLDFTEQLWTLLVDQSASGAEIAFALNEVFETVSQGNLIPYIHKENHTVFGDHIRDSIFLSRAIQYGYSSDTHGDAKVKDMATWISNTRELFPIFGAVTETNASSHQLPVQTSRMLVELGMWKLERDFNSWLYDFNTISSSSGHSNASPSSINRVDSVIQWFDGNLPRESDDKVKLLHKFTSLLALRDITQVAHLGQQLHVPKEELMQLVVSLVQYQQKQFSVDETDLMKASRSFPTFPVQIKSSLPWLKFAASGLFTLPTPTFWNVKTSNKQSLKCAFMSPMESNGCGLASQHVSGQLLDAQGARSASRMVVQAVAKQSQMPADWVASRLRRELKYCVPTLGRPASTSAPSAGEPVDEDDRMSEDEDASPVPEAHTARHAPKVNIVRMDGVETSFSCFVGSIKTVSISL